MVQEAENEFLRVFLLPEPVTRHDFLHVRLYHSDAWIPARVCFLDVHYIGA